MTGRGLGLVGALSALPGPVVAALSLLTLLGSVPAFAAALAGVYLFRDRRGGAFAAGVALGGLALTVALKAAFALPRPPLSGWLVAADGYGFPSGHALGAVVTWGVLALVLDVGSRRRRAALAGVVVALVAVSRVALGVHYVVDVLAGAAVGLVYLAAVVRWSGYDPLRAFAAAVAVALAAVGLAGGADAAMVLGAAVGGVAAWVAVEVPERPWGRADVAPATIGGAAFGGVAAFGLVADPPAPLAFAAGVAAAGGLIALPALVGWVLDDGEGRPSGA